MQYKEDPEWSILDAYFQDHMYPFTKHHLDSYKQFLKVYIPQTIRSYNPITMIKFGEENDEAVKVEVNIGGKDQTAIFLDRPTMIDEEGKPILLLPHEARLRNITYSTKLYANIEVVYSKDGEHYKTVNFANVLLGSIPLMLHSDQCVLHGQGSKVVRAMSECPMDSGGYFIIDGKEKVIISQERIVANKLIIDKQNDPDILYKGFIRCTGSSGESALVPRTVQFLVITPEPKKTAPPPKKKGAGAAADKPDGDKPDGDGGAEGAEDEGGAGAAGAPNSYKTVRGGIFMSIQGLNGVIPLTTVFRALGFETDRSIVEAIFGNVDNVHPAYLNFIRPSITHGHAIKIQTIEEAHQNLKPRTYFKSVQQVKSILTQDLFPNIDIYTNTNSLREKGIYLGYLVNKIIKTALGVAKETDRDSYMFKRIDISGYLLAELFQETYSKFRKNIRNELDRTYNFGHVQETGKLEDLINKSNINRIFTPVHITETFTRSLKGMWGIVTDDPDQGKVQDLSRISYIGFMSHLRRVNIPLDRSIKITSPHRLHSQQWGRICPFETPDGASVGYLKNLAILTQITSGTSAATLYPLLEELKIVTIRELSVLAAAARDAIRVFINGSMYGITDQPHLVVNTMRLYRRNGLINPFVSVAWNIAENEIQIHTEAGRPCRPLLILENQKVVVDKIRAAGAVKWFDMVYGSALPEKDKREDSYYEDKYIAPDTLSNLHNKDPLEILKLLEEAKGGIEYLDVEEENTMLVAMKRDDINVFHTHLEINPISLFSVVTQMVPFSNSNQAPRIVFHGSQSKQAIGIYSTNFNNRFDTMGYIQHYPQKRIITTRGCHYNGMTQMPNGANVIVAIMTYSGFNQEDSVMINKTSIDRGLFQITAYKTLSAIEKTLSPNDRLIFANPIKMRNEGIAVAKIKHADYSLLDDHGFIAEGSYIPRGQNVVILGMVHVKQQLKNVTNGVLSDKVVEEVYTDVSIVTDAHHYGRIDKIFVGSQTPSVGTSGGAGGATGPRVCKVRFRKIRRPELGDKHCSSHAQKGVVGMIIPQEDMPFSKNGVVPDIIINPHCMPTRMTIGHLLETVFAKLCCMDGVIGDGTVFIPFDRAGIYDSLEKHGYEKYGNEILYNGKTGNQVETDVFIGPILYYRLKHMVTDKIHARDKGPKTQLTRQPTAGRSKDGGLRLGEMERDVLVSHGLAQFIKESMMEKSDKYRWGVCRFCGVLAKYTPAEGIVECVSCDRQDIVVVETPYSFKLLVQEMESMGIQIRLSPDEVPGPDTDGSDSDSDASDAESLPMPNVIREEDAGEAADSDASDSEDEESADESDEEESAETTEETTEESSSAADTVTSELMGGASADAAIENNQIISDFVEDQLEAPLTEMQSLPPSSQIAGTGNDFKNVATFEMQRGGNVGSGAASGTSGGDVKVIEINDAVKIAEPKDSTGSGSGSGSYEEGGSGGGDADEEFFA